MRAWTNWDGGMYRARSETELAKPGRGRGRQRGCDAARFIHKRHGDAVAGAEHTCAEAETREDRGHAQPDGARRRQRHQRACEGGRRWQWCRLLTIPSARGACGLEDRSRKRRKRVHPLTDDGEGQGEGDDAVRGHGGAEGHGDEAAGGEGAPEEGDDGGGGGWREAEGLGGVGVEPGAEAVLGAHLAEGVRGGVASPVEV